MKRRRRRGFSLIELLVVIAVLGALMAMLFPALSGARSQAKRAMCSANLKQIGVGMRSYLSENRDRFPHASFLPSVSPFPVSGETAIRIADVLLPSVGGEPRVFHCPNDESGASRPDANNGKSYFESDGSSYEYRIRPPLGGRTMTEVAALFGQFADRTVAEISIWVMRDYDNFHEKAGRPGARRYLYVDGHVTDYEN